MIINYNSLSSGRDAWLKNDVGEVGGSPPAVSVTSKKSWLARMIFFAVMLVGCMGQAQIALPYTETFASITAANGFPAVTGGAWTRSGTTTNQPTYIANQVDYNRSGNGDAKFMAFNWASSTRYYYVGPFALTGGTSYTASTLYKADGTTGFGPLALTYGATATTAAQTNVITSVAANITNTAFQTLSGAFTPATTGNYFLAIRCLANGNPWYLTVDDFSLSLSPSCVAPGSVSGVPTSDTAANFSWPASASAPSLGYQWEVRSSGAAGSGASGLADSGSTGAGILTASTSILTASTAYTIYVRAHCSATDNSAWRSASFATPCAAVGVPYIIDFNSVTVPAIPSCTSIITPTGNPWITSAGVISSGFPASAGNYLRYNYSSTTAANTWFFTRGVNLTAGTQYAISYKYSGTTFTEKLAVKYGSAATVAGMTNALATYPSILAPGSDLVTFSPPTTGVYYFGFQAYSAADQNVLQLDDIKIDLAPTCLVPTNLAVAQTLDGGNFTWGAPTSVPALGYEWAVTTSETAPTASGTLVTTTSASVTGLPTDTFHYLHVRSVCSATEKTDWVSKLFITGYCLANVTSPADGYITAFSTTGGATNITNTGTTYNARGYSNFSSLSVSTIENSPVSFSTTENNAGEYYYGTAIFVDFNNDLDFDDAGERLYNSANSTAPITRTGTFTIPVGTIPGNYRMRVKLDYINYAVPVPGCGTTAVGETEDYTLTVLPPPTCVVPTALAVSAITNTTATLAWTAPATPVSIGYEYEVRTAGTAGSGATGLTLSGTTAAGVVTANISTLTALTSYSVYVRAHCATTDFSAWTPAATFTTQGLVTTPWSEAFATTAVPAGWLTTGYTIAAAPTALAGASGNVIYKNIYGTAPTGLFTTINVGPVLANQVLAFDYMLANFSSPYAAPAVGSGNFVVEVSTNFGATYTALETVANDAVAGWRTKTYPLSGYVGQNIKIRITANRTDGDYYIGFDNFKVQEVCSGTPAGGTVVPALQNMCVGTPALPLNATGAAAALGITYQWQQSTNNGVTWVNAIGGSNATTLAYTPPNFEGTRILYRLKVTCTNSSTESFSAVSEINANPKALPLHESFTELNALGGWTVNGAVGIGAARGATGNPGSNAIANLWSGATTAKLTSPNYGLITAGMAFSFDLKLSNFATPFAAPAAGWGSVVVEVSTDCGGSFTPVGTITTFTGSDYVNYKYDLSGYVGSAVITRLSLNWLAGDYDVSIDNWSIDVPAPQITGFTPDNVCAANQSTVNIAGYAFTGATAVTFNGTNAVSFLVNSDTSITAVAPAGLTSGTLAVTTAKGTGTSTSTFAVTPSPVVAPIENGGGSLCVGDVVTLVNPTTGGTWGTLTPALVTVSSNGEVIAVAGGTATITYTVSDFGCSTVVTSEITVNSPVVSSNPTAQTVVTGNNATFSVAATGNILGYQWRVSTNNGASFTDLSETAPYSGTTSATLTISGTPDNLNGNFYQVYLTAASPCADFESPGAKLNVGDTGIDVDPANFTLCSTGNGVAEFSVIASGTVTGYIWEEDRAFGPQPVVDGTFDGITYSGATTNTLTVSGLDVNATGWTYIAKVVGPANSIDSNPATLTVNEGVSVTVPEAQTVCSTGGTTSFTVEATGGVAGIQWQYALNGGAFANVVNGTPAGATYTGNTTATLGVTTTAATPATGSHQYRAVVNGEAGCDPVPSDPAQLNIYAPAITSQPANAAAYTGTTPTFTVGSVPGATFQWQYATAVDGPFNNVADSTPAGITYTGADTATLSVVLSSTASASVARYYRAVVTEGGCSSTSAAAQLSISAYCAPTTSSGTMSATNGISNVVLTNVSAGTNLTQASSAVAPWYALYTANTFNVVQGQDVSVAITFGSDATQHSGVWIDYDRNGSFEANENVGLSTAATVTGANGTKIYTFTIPYTAATGNTRLRIRGGANAVYTAGGACLTAAFGETEDYVVNIATAPACTGTPVAGTAVSSVSSVCQSGTTVLSASGFSSGVTGITTQWHNTVTGPIAGATLATYTTSAITQTSSYFLRVTCANGGFSDSNIVTVTVNNPQVTASTGAQRCGTGAVTLNATGSAGTTLGWYAAATGGSQVGSGATFSPTVSATTNYYVSAELIAAGSASVGAGVSTGTDISYNLTNGSYGGFKAQYLITAAELSASGIKAGNINSVAFEATTAGATLQGFTVQMGTTALTTFPTPVSILGGLSTVVNNVTVVPTVGVNTLTFGTPFNWDGTSNIVVSTSWSNNNSLNTSSTLRYDTTANYTSQSYRVDNATPEVVLAFTGTASLASRSLSRPKLTFGAANVSSCSSARTTVTATVTTPPALTLSTPSVSFCVGASTVTPVTITSTVSDYNSYVWSPATGVSGTSATGYTFSPAATTTYTLTATNAAGCGNTTTINVVVNPLPTSKPITPATAQVCLGDTQMLTTGPNTLTATLGTGTTATGNTSYPNPLSAYYGGAKHQMLYTAAELAAQGLASGSSITTVSFYLNAFNATSSCQNFTIRMGATNNTALTGFVTGTANVYGPTTFIPTETGLVTFTLTTPYVWNGTSNLVLETVHNAGNGGSGSGNNTRVTTTAMNTVFSAASDDVAGGIAGFDAEPIYDVSAPSTSRPNVTFTATTPSPVWSPATNLFTDAGATIPYTGQALNTVYAKLQTGATYTATFTSGANCSASSTATLTVATPVVWYVDADGDNYGNAALPTVLSCTKPTGYAALGTDCDDTPVTGFAINPGVAEIFYNGIDDNCSGTIDEGRQLLTKLVPEKCGTTLTKIYQSVNCEYRVPGATAFRFRIRNVDNPSEAVQIVDRQVHYFGFNQLTTYHYATNYSVDVMVQRNGVWLGYYGDACNIKTPDAPTLAVCGGTVATKGTFVHSEVLLYATGYRFQVTSVASQQVTLIDNGRHYFTFNEIAGFTAGGQYSVKVSVKTTGTEWTAYGSACVITAPGGVAPEIPTDKIDVAANVFKVAAYPNPYADAFGLDITTASKALVNLKVYDMLGKLIEVREVSVADLKEQRIGDRYPAGVYNIIVTQEENVKTLRVIKR